eukprot:gnl/MRDRNA2_/MRDRNA2_94504_c0_seq1.p1 gnl/MRDRNA2_/MRDRNA2_94504_c0~~gnl/MRDRNA2_/MRDRNA2_94504_c0_seq1.p1  ORF type:complete len:284 (-),score=114.71 gnl/MRDRNA2_/MRDRNA2_94504_c0_seq1:155-1006(-)
MVAISAVTFLCTLLGAFALTQKHTQDRLSTEKGWVLGEDQDDDDAQEKQAQETALDQARMQGKEAAWQAQLDAATKEGYEQGLAEAEQARRSVDAAKENEQLMAQQKEEAEAAAKAREAEERKQKAEEERIEMEQIQQQQQAKVQQQQLEEEQSKAKALPNPIFIKNPYLEAIGVSEAEQQAMNAAQREKREDGMAPWQFSKDEQELQDVNKQLAELQAQSGMSDEEKAQRQAEAEYKKQTEDCFKFGCLKKPDQKSIFDKMLDGMKGLTGDKASKKAEEQMQ